MSDKSLLVESLGNDWCPDKCTNIVIYQTLRQGSSRGDFFAIFLGAADALDILKNIFVMMDNIQCLQKRAKFEIVSL